MMARLTPFVGRRQQGVGLIELMISLVIGLMLLGAVAYFFLGSQEMNRTHDDMSRMQESGRNAMEILGKAIRQAGYRLDPDQPLYINTANNISALAGRDNGGTGSAAPPDTITVRHDPTWVPNATNPVNGSEVDCQGNIVDSNNDTLDSFGGRIQNTLVVAYSFRIATVAGIPSLYCNSVALNPATGGTLLVDNIENMQISYGIDNLRNGTITSYKTAPSVAEFDQVAAVRVSLLVRGPSSNIAVNKSQTYNYNGATVTATDGFLRQVYTSTFTVRNQTR
jgi:type IV pilus assembly protein PilW